MELWSSSGTAARVWPCPWSGKTVALGVIAVFQQRHEEAIRNRAGIGARYKDVIKNLLKSQPSALRPAPNSCFSLIEAEARVYPQENRGQEANAVIGESEARRAGGRFGGYPQPVQDHPRGHAPPAAAACGAGGKVRIAGAHFFNSAQSLTRVHAAHPADEPD